MAKAPAAEVIVPGPDGDRPVTMIAGGTGLAPMKSILLAMSMNADNPDVHLLVGTRSPGLLYDSEALAPLAATNPWLKVTQVTDARRDPWWLKHPATAYRALPLRHGSLLDAMDGLDLTGHRVLIAGPRGLLRAASEKAASASAGSGRSVRTTLPSAVAAPPAGPGHPAVRGRGRA